MTTPQERTRAILRASEFLLSLVDPKKTPHTPRYVRDEARRVSKHFPFPVDLLELAQRDSSMRLLDAAVVEHYQARNPSG